MSDIHSLREFAEIFVGANTFIISDEFTTNMQSCLLRRVGDSQETDIGFMSRAEYANNVIEFLSDNGLEINDELNEFIQRWRKVPYYTNPRFGFDATRSLDGNNIVFIGGKIKHDENWFINDYDFSAAFPANTDIRDLTDGAIKLGYDLNQERFTSIKLYSRNNTMGELGHNLFFIDENNNVTFQDRNFCEHTSAFNSADSAPTRWQDKAQEVVDLVNKYNGANNMVISFSTSERTPDENGDWDKDQGGISFSAWQRQLTGADAPDNTDPDINNPYKVDETDRYFTLNANGVPLATANT